MDRNSAKRLAQAGVGGGVLWRRGWEPRYRAISCLRTGGLLGAAVSLAGGRAGTAARLEDRLLALACGEAASWNGGRGCHLRIAVSLGARGEFDAFMLDVPRNMALANKYWSEEVNGSNAFWQRSKRMVFRVPHYKSGAELAQEVARARK